MGFFNFWDMYLILKKDNVKGIYSCLVKRDDREFHGQMTEEQKLSMVGSIANSVYFKKPEEMFKDFPEMEKFDYFVN